MEKNFYERRAYESVDDGSPSWVTSQKLTKSKIQAAKGLQVIRSWGYIIQGFKVTYGSYKS